MKFKCKCSHWFMFPQQSAVCSMSVHFEAMAMSENSHNRIRGTLGIVRVKWDWSIEEPLCSTKLMLLGAHQEVKRDYNQPEQVFPLASPWVGCKGRGINSYPQEPLRSTRAVTWKSQLSPAVFMMLLLFVILIPFPQRKTPNSQIVSPILLPKGFLSQGTNTSSDRQSWKDKCWLRKRVRFLAQIFQEGPLQAFPDSSKFSLYSESPRQ